MNALAEAFPEDGIVVLEAPSSTLAVRHQLRLSRPGSYYFGAGGGLGFGLAAAVGVQLAQPDRPVVCVVGEGSAQYAITALWSAAAYSVPLTVLVLRNAEYAILKWFADVEGVERRPGPRPALAELPRRRGGLRRRMRARSPAGATSWSRRCAMRSAPPSRGWSRCRSRPGCGCSSSGPRARLGRRRHARAAPLGPDPPAGRGRGPRPGDRPDPLRVRRQPVPADPAGRRPAARAADDVARVIAYAREHDIPVTFRAGGTSLNGQGQSDGILVDVRRHWRGVEVLDDGARARVKPGTVLGHANRVLAPHGRKLGPDPASTDIATVGGVIANNSGGMRCGTWADAYSTVAEMTFLTAGGTLIDTAEPGAAERFAQAEPRAGAWPGRDPRRDPGRRRADRADPPQVRDQEHHRLSALRVPRRRRAARDLPAPDRRLRGHPRADLRGGVRDRSGAAARPRPPGSTSPGSTRPASRYRAWSSWARARSS